MTEAEWRARIVEVARGQIGVRFQHQARAPGVALDCAGLLVHEFDSLGLPYVDLIGYPRLPYGGMIEKILGQQPSLQLINTHEADDGDVYLMRMFRLKDPMHVAIKSPHGIIHAYADSGRVVEHRMPSDWIPKIVNTYRILRPAYAQ
jgi:hypothetical protein